MATSSSSSSSRVNNISDVAKKIEVDNRIPLRDYYRLAEDLTKQADICRKEKNIIDLYAVLLRFASLITETIPAHQDYQISQHREKNAYKKKLLGVLDELEVLKPDVERRVSELNGKSLNQIGVQKHAPKINKLKEAQKLLEEMADLLHSLKAIVSEPNSLAS